MRAELQLAEILSAWNVPGTHPEHHREWKERLRREWPVLAKAIDKANASQQESTMTFYGGMGGNQGGKPAALRMAVKILHHLATVKEQSITYFCEMHGVGLEGMELECGRTDDPYLLERWRMRVRGGEWEPWVEYRLTGDGPTP